MVLLALTDIVVLLELLVGLVIIGKDIVAIISTLNTEMVVCGIGKSTLSVSGLDDALGKSDGGRYAVPPHLLTCIARVKIYVIYS